MHIMPFTIHLDAISRWFMLIPRQNPTVLIRSLFIPTTAIYPTQWVLRWILWIYYAALSQRWAGTWRWWNPWNNASICGKHVVSCRLIVGISHPSKTSRKRDTWICRTIPFDCGKAAMRYLQNEICTVESKLMQALKLILVLEGPFFISFQSFFNFLFLGWFLAKCMLLESGNFIFCP